MNLISPKEYEQIYLEVVQLYAAFEVLRTENEILKEKLYMAKSTKKPVKKPVKTADTTQGDPLPPDPTHPKP